MTTGPTLPGYDVGAVIGTGGMATVYRAHDLRHDRTVAIKVLKPDAAARVGAERLPEFQAYLDEVRVRWERFEP